jgi:hypothetical protein
VSRLRDATPRQSTIVGRTEEQPRPGVSVAPESVTRYVGGRRLVCATVTLFDSAESVVYESTPLSRSTPTFVVAEALAGARSRATAEIRPTSVDLNPVSVFLSRVLLIGMPPWETTLAWM